MIRRMVSRLRLVAPPGRSVVLAACCFACLEGGTVYLERQMGRPLNPSFRLGRFYLILACAQLGIYRVRAFHPYFQSDYLSWLKATPWTVRKPLPAGPVELVPEDLLAMGGLILLSWFLPAPHSIELVNTFLFSHMVALVATFWRTGVAGFGYTAALFLGFVPQLWTRPWLDLAVLSALYLFVHEGLWRSLAGFPWSTEGAAADARAEGLEEAYGPQCGWPYDRFLRDVRSARGIGWADALLISMLAGWWVYSLQAWFQSELFRLLMLMQSLAIFVFYRLVNYRRGYAPPISLAGRLATFRWIIPGHDQIFLGPAFALFGMGGGAALALWLGGGLREVIPLAIFFVTLLGLTSPPSLKRWRLTGQHRLVSGFSKPNPFFVKVG
jgi:hypothetical protein